MRPAVRVAMFWIRIEMKVAVNPFTIKLSEASLVVSWPPLFFGKSNHGIGIFTIFENASIRTFLVILSPTIEKIDELTMLTKNPQIAMNVNIKA